MANPAVPIEVDPESGIWRTDGLPMLYLPRHFLVNNHRAVEQALGREAYRAILREATETSAIHWCRSEAETHGLSPEATFRHYFLRLSQRGWGQFSVDSLETLGGAVRSVSGTRSLPWRQRCKAISRSASCSKDSSSALFGFC
jgi:hypothetical protein